MIQIILENEAGVLALDGADNTPWKIRELAGLGMSDKSFRTATYSAQAGICTLGEQRGARIITISGDVCEGALPVTEELARAIRILDAPVWITVCICGKARRIRGRCSAFEPGERYGPYRQFRMQLVCDCPFFEDPESKSVPLFERKKNIKTVFRLPCAMSERIAKGTVINRGDVETEPVFEIYFGSGARTRGETELVLHNLSTERRLELTVTPVLGESVVIDIPNRKIYGSRGENLIASLSEGSSLAAFGLAKGANVIEISSEYVRELSVICRFANRYLEAVY